MWNRQTQQVQQENHGTTAAYHEPAAQQTPAKATRLLRHMSAGNTDGHGACGSLQTATPLHRGAVRHRPAEHTPCHPPFSSTDSSDSSTDGAALPCHGLYAEGCWQLAWHQPTVCLTIDHWGLSSNSMCGQELYFSPTIKPHWNYAGFWRGGEYT